MKDGNRLKFILLLFTPRAWRQFFSIKRPLLSWRFTSTRVETMCTISPASGSPSVHLHARGDNTQTF